MLAKPASKLAMPKAAAAAAGVGGEAIVPSPEIPESMCQNQSMISSATATAEAPEAPSAYMSSAVADEPEVETFEPQVETFEPQVAEEGPKIAVDPMMAEGGAKGGGGVSFSEMTELPPLKEVYIPPPPPPSPVEPVHSAAPTVRPCFRAGQKADEKPKVQPREVAEKAIKEIKGVPPKLMAYAIGGAIALILVIGIGVTIYVHSLNSDDDSGATRPAAAAETPAQPEASQPAPKKEPAPAQPVEFNRSRLRSLRAGSAQSPVASSKARNARKKAAPAPVIIPGQLAIDSTPQGAQVQVDGKTDPSYVTPFALTNLQPGQHSITVSKAGYSTDTRTVNVTAGNRATASGPPVAVDGNAGGEERSAGSQHLRGWPRCGRQNSGAGQRG